MMFRIDCLNFLTRQQPGQEGLAGKLYLVEEDGVCEGNLALCFIHIASLAALLQLLLQVVGIHHCDNAVQAHTAVKLCVRPQR